MSRPMCRVALVGGQTDLCIDATNYYRTYGTRLSDTVSQKPSEPYTGEAASQSGFLRFCTARNWRWLVNG